MESRIDEQPSPLEAAKPEQQTRKAAAFLRKAAAERIPVEIATQ